MRARDLTDILSQLDQDSNSMVPYDPEEIVTNFYGDPETLKMAPSWTASTTTPYSSIVMADSPSGYWKFDEAGVLDSTLNRLNGSTSGGVTTGATGPMPSPEKAYTFNGTTGFAKAPVSALLHPGDTFSFECWIKRVGTGTVQNIASAGTNDYDIHFNALDKLVLSKQGVGDIFVTTPAYTDTTSWHHVVVTKAAAVSAIYVDGASAAGTTANSSLVASATQVHFAVFSSEAANFLSASLDEIVIYPTALTQTQVTNHYNAGISAGAVNYIWSGSQSLYGKAQYA